MHQSCHCYMHSLDKILHIFCAFVDGDIRIREFGFHIRATSCYRQTTDKTGHVYYSVKQNIFLFKNEKKNSRKEKKTCNFQIIKPFIHTLKVQGSITIRRTAIPSMLVNFSTFTFLLNVSFMK